MARAKGRSILGPEPREVIGEVPVDRVRANGIGWLTTWLERTDDAENAVHMVLTACRIWRFAVDAEHSSKTGAARWALERDPSLTGVEQALTARTTVDAARITHQESRRAELPPHPCPLVRRSCPYQPMTWTGSKRFPRNFRICRGQSAFPTRSGIRL